MRRLIAVTAALACSPVLAQEGLGPYLGLGVDTLDYEDNMLIWFDVGDTVVSPKLVAGYRFNDTLAFEATYSNSGDFSKSLSGAVPTFRDSVSESQVFGGGYTANYTGNFDVLALRVLAHAKYMVFGVSYFMSDHTGRITGTTDGMFNPIFGPPTFNPDRAGDFTGIVNDSDNGYSIIIGAQWDIGRWAVRPEYEYFDVSSPADASTFGVQFHYGF